MVAEISFVYLEVPPTRWTFEPDAVRKWVESHLEGRVLNLFAGETKLSHSREIVRNDIDESKDADYHFDAKEVRKFFNEDSFDTVILDPPYNVRKSREKYNGTYRGGFTRVKDLLPPIIRDGGKTVHFGYDSTGMSRKRGFVKEEICLLNHKGDHDDTIAVVERKTEDVPDEDLLHYEGVSKRQTASIDW